MNINVSVPQLYFRRFSDNALDVVRENQDFIQSAANNNFVRMQYQERQVLFSSTELDEPELEEATKAASELDNEELPELEVVNSVSEEEPGNKGVITRPRAFMSLFGILALVAAGFGYTTHKENQELHSQINSSTLSDVNDGTLLDETLLENGSLLDSNAELTSQNAGLSLELEALKDDYLQVEIILADNGFETIQEFNDALTNEEFDANSRHRALTQLERYLGIPTQAETVAPNLRANMIQNEIEAQTETAVEEALLEGDPRTIQALIDIYGLPADSNREDVIAAARDSQALNVRLEERVTNIHNECNGLINLPLCSLFSG